MEKNWTKQMKIGQNGQYWTKENMEKFGHYWKNWSIEKIT